MRLIDADALKAKLEKLKCNNEDLNYTEKMAYNFGIIRAINFVNRSNTVDAVTVVRCKDCRWSYEINGYFCCELQKGLAHCKPDSFCSWGGRRNG